MANVIGSPADDILAGTVLADLIRGKAGDDLLEGSFGADTLKGGAGDDMLDGGNGDDLLRGGAREDDLSGGVGSDTLKGGGGDDLLAGGNGADLLKGGSGDDTLDGGAGDDMLRGGAGDDLLRGGAGADELRGGRGDDNLEGGDGADLLKGGGNNDTLEGGAGNDTLRGGAGDDVLYAFSWGGEPVPAQDATAQVESNEPIEDNDILIGGRGADRFEFRWLIDAKEEILDKHRDATGDVDYSGNGVAGENDNTHDHWVETIGVKTVVDYKAGEDTLVFAGHTVELGNADYTDVNGDGKTDTVLNFVSNQGAGGGAHNGDEVGTVILLGVEVAAADIQVHAHVHYGVEDPWSADG